MVYLNLGSFDVVMLAYGWVIRDSILRPCYYLFSDKEGAQVFLSITDA